MTTSLVYLSFYEFGTVEYSVLLFLYLLSFERFVSLVLLSVYYINSVLRSYICEENLTMFSYKVTRKLAAISNVL